MGIKPKISNYTTYIFPKKMVFRIVGSFYHTDVYSSVGFSNKVVFFTKFVIGADINQCTGSVHLS